MCPGVCVEGLIPPHTWEAGASLCPSCTALVSMASHLFWTNFPDEFGKVPLYHYGNTTLWRIKSLFVQCCVPGSEGDGLNLCLVSLSS